MNNSVFGKTMKNLKNRNHVMLIKNKVNQKLVSRPSFFSQKISSKELVAVRLIKGVLTIYMRMRFE